MEGSISYSGFWNFVVCFGSGSVARGKRAGFNFPHAGGMTHLLQWFCVLVTYCYATTNPKLAGLKQQVFHYFSGFCELPEALQDHFSTGLTWSLSCSCIHMAAMAGHFSSVFQSCVWYLSAPCMASFFSNVVWYSSGELRFPRKRKHKLPVF